MLLVVALRCMLGAAVTVAAPTMDGHRPGKSMEMRGETEESVVPLLLPSTLRTTASRTARATLRVTLEDPPSNKVAFGFNAFGTRYNVTALTRCV